jgi:hypothetical protein
MGLPGSPKNTIFSTIQARSIFNPIRTPRLKPSDGKLGVKSLHPPYHSPGLSPLLTQRHRKLLGGIFWLSCCGDLQKAFGRGWKARRHSSGSHSEPVLGVRIASDGAVQTIWLRVLERTCSSLIAGTDMSPLLVILGASAGAVLRRKGTDLFNEIGWEAVTGQAGWCVCGETAARHH